MNELVLNLRQRYPDITFIEGTVFHWSPKNKQVFYSIDEGSVEATWSLLHETGHALLEHASYSSDMQLLKKELAAWEKAKQIAPSLGITIDDNHVQDCLDSYRDWIHKRSSCPACTLKGFQDTPETYTCLNCKTTWHVTLERFCRPYRRSE